MINPIRSKDLLADLIVEFDGGILSELAAKKNPKIEEDLRRQLEAEVRSEL